MFRVAKRVYGLVYVGLIGSAAGLVLMDELTVVNIIGFAGLIGSLFFCSAMCRTEDYGFLEGLSNLSSKYSSGLANITMCYLMPIFFMLHMYCVLLSVIGLFVGRGFTVRKWQRITEKPVAPAFNPEFALEPALEG